MSPRNALRRFVPVAVIAAFVGITACGSSNKNGGGSKLDTSKVEKAIIQSVKQQRGVTPKVSCPDNVKKAKGVVFNCSATSSKGNATFVVTEQNDQGFVTYIAK